MHDYVLDWSQMPCFSAKPEYGPPLVPFASVDHTAGVPLNYEYDNSYLICLTPREIYICLAKYGPDWLCFHFFWFFLI